MKTIRTIAALSAVFLFAAVVSAADVSVSVASAREVSSSSSWAGDPKTKQSDRSKDSYSQTRKLLVTVARVSNEIQAAEIEVVWLRPPVYGQPKTIEFLRKKIPVEFGNAGTVTIEVVGEWIGYQSTSDLWVVRPVGGGVAIGETTEAVKALEAKR